MRIRLPQLLFSGWVALAMACTTPPEDAPPEIAEVQPVEVAPKVASASTPAAGFLVWESNRSGRWRIWIRDLAGGEPRQLSPDQGRNLHCCPHISPDGEHIVYLSLAPDQEGYPQGGAVGPMMRIRPDGSEVETLVPEARTYYENRAAVWRSPAELIYIQEDGRTALLDLATGGSSVLTREADPHGPWLINSNLTWAASGNGALVPFLERRKTVANRPPKPGCQPYFSHDGRWGFWVVAPGGPIDRLQLASESRSNWLKKSDPRLPEDFGYLYFPMLSTDGRLLAFAASDDDHPHFEADYEIFVVETDPQTLEILGSPTRWTHNPATDRFPDVYLAPLPLGRDFGEAPFQWTVDPEMPEVDWQWTYGDGSGSTGPTGEHTYREAGIFQVRATSAGQTLVGQVSVSPSAPPRILSSSLRNRASDLILAFDEPIDITQMDHRLESGTPIAGQTLERDGHQLVLHLDKPLRRADFLHIEGISDRAQSPNSMKTVRLEIAPPTWPVSTADLVFVWEHGDAPNLLFDPALGADTAVTLTPRGTARFDSDFAMQPAGGHFEIAAAAADRICLACKKTYEISIEMVVTPSDPAVRRGVIMASASKSRRNFSLEEEAGRIYFGQRMKSRGDDAFPRVHLTDLPPGRQSHLVVTYSPGTIKAYLDGQLKTTDSSVAGGYFHWRSAPLRFGSDWNGKSPWRGRLEGVAIYSRALAAKDVRESYSRYQSKLETRPELPSWIVQASLEICSERPTLQQIDPYRQALITCRYRIEDEIIGHQAGAEIRVAQWAILDGRPLTTDPTRTTAEFELTLFDDNPQLASVYLSDTLEPPAKGPLFYRQAP